MKYSINFICEKCKNNLEEGNIRMVLQWSGGGRLALSVGHRVTIAKWSKDAQRCKQNTMHGVYSSTRINKDIQRYEDAANVVMQYYDDPPKSADVKNALLKQLGKRGAEDKGHDVERDIHEFIIEQSRLKNWAEGTSKRYFVLLRILKSIFPSFCYADILTTKALEDLTLRFQDSGLKATTIRGYISEITWFLRWAERKGYIQEAPAYKARLKTAPRKVIFLTEEELMRLYNADFEVKSHRRARDFFCFCCFTGLRHSDAYSLQRNAIQDGVIRIVSRKDTDSLIIELNKFSKAILERAELKKTEELQGYALPHVKVEHMNKTIREIAKACHIDEPTTIVYYQGGKRVEQIKPKYECLTSHVGRKTFICTALSHGISPNIIMKWTGHSSYDAMRPYVDIANDAKKNAMSIFDELGAGIIDGIKPVQSDESNS